MPNFSQSPHSGTWPTVQETGIHRVLLCPHPTLPHAPSRLRHKEAMPTVCAWSLLDHFLNPKAQNPLFKQSSRVSRPTDDEERPLVKCVERLECSQTCTGSSYSVTLAVGGEISNGRRRAWLPPHPHALTGNSRFRWRTSSTEQLALLTNVVSRQTSTCILVPKSQDCKGWDTEFRESETSGGWRKLSILF